MTRTTVLEKETVQATITVFVILDFMVTIAAKVTVFQQIIKGFLF